MKFYGAFGVACCGLWQCGDGAQVRSSGRKEWEEAVRGWKRIGRGVCCVIAAGDFVAGLPESRVPGGPR